MPELPILVLNGGSSSIKFSIYQTSAGKETALFDGAADGIGSGNGAFHVQDAQGGKIIDEKPTLTDIGSAFKLIADALQKPPFPRPGAVGHRMVAGGPHLRHDVRVTEGVLSELHRYSSFAPLHNPPALDIIAHVQELFPDLPSFVCFDSSFHVSIPETAARFPIPERYWDEGIRRYGAHGISCESIVYQLAGNIPPRLIVAHLGNGCSITAIKDGESVDTSMGLSPTGGIMSGTRTGDIDPGVLIYLLRDLKSKDDKSLTRDEAAQQLELLVNHHCGLAGTADGRSDMRDLRTAIRNGDELAAMTVSQFTYVLRKFIGSYLAVLGGLDMLVFTGGIGEHDSATRAEVCSGLEQLGILLDPERNATLEKDAQGQSTISTAASRVKVLVIPPEEDLMIARHVSSMLHA